MLPTARQLTYVRIHNVHTLQVLWSVDAVEGPNGLQQAIQRLGLVQGSEDTDGRLQVTNDSLVVLTHKLCGDDL
jgi:hypothetical protein